MESDLHGFEISYDRTRRMLTLRVHGFWDEELGQQFEQEFQKNIKAIQAHDERWYLFVDFTKGSIQSPNVQKIIRNAMVCAKQAGMEKKAILVNGVIEVSRTKNSLFDTEFQFDFYFQSEEDALRWLLNEDKDGG